MMLSILVCQSRGGAIALLGGLVALAVLRRRGSAGARSWPRAVVATAGLAALAVVLVLVLPQPSRDRLAGLRDAGADPAGAFRLETWRSALRAGMSSPLVGFGLGAFADALPPYKSSSGELRVEHAENDAVEQFVESGTIGVVLGLVAVLLLIRGFATTSGGEVSRLHAGVGAGAGAGVVALAIHGLVDFNLHVPSNAILFSLLLAIRMGFDMQCEPTRCLRISAAPLLLCLVLVPGLATRAQAPPRPDLASLQGRPDGMRSRLVESGLVRHLQRRPADAEAWVLLGWLRARAGELATGRALAAHGASLDPQRRALAVAVPPEESAKR
jgi:hypothetical protein